MCLWNCSEEKQIKPNKIDRASAKSPIFNLITRYCIRCCSSLNERTWIFSKILIYVFFSEIELKSEENLFFLKIKHTQSRNNVNASTLPFLHYKLLLCRDALSYFSKMLNLLCLFSFEVYYITEMN